MSNNRLSGKQIAFINAYLGKANFNATKAAKIAGYKGNGVTLASVGFENIRKPNIAEEIAKRLQASTMSANELLMRLGDQARVDVSPYYDSLGYFNLDQFKMDGYGHLIKAIKITHHGPVIEFVDRLKSQELIGRHLAMFTDNVKTDVTHNVSEDSIDALRNRIFSVKTKRGNQLDTK